MMRPILPLALAALALVGLSSGAEAAGVVVCVAGVCTATPPLPPTGLPPLVCQSVELPGLLDLGVCAP